MNSANKVRLVQKHHYNGIEMRNEDQIKREQHHFYEDTVRKTEDQKPELNRNSLIAILGGLVVFAILLTVSMLRFYPADRVAAATAEPVKFADLEKLVSGKTAEYLARNRQLLEEFKREAASAGQNEFNRAHGNVKGCLDQMTTFAATAKLCCKMAKDKVKGSRDTRDCVIGIVRQPVVHPCMRGSEEIYAAYRKFCLKVEENRSQYYADLSHCMKGLDIKTVPQEHRVMVEQLGNIGGRIAEIAATKAVIVVSGAVELATIRTTLACLRSVCGHIVKKLAGSATIAGISALADGPLPFGDAVGVVCFSGGLVWCAYDIHQVVKVLPGQLESAMHRMIDSTRRDAQLSVIRHAEELTVSCEKEALTVQTNLKQN